MASEEALDAHGLNVLDVRIRVLGPSVQGLLLAILVFYDDFDHYAELREVAGVASWHFAVPALARVEGGVEHRPPLL